MSNLCVPFKWAGDCVHVLNRKCIVSIMCHTFIRNFQSIKEQKYLVASMKAIAQLKVMCGRNI